MLGFTVKILDVHTLISYGTSHCKLYSLVGNKYTTSKLYSYMVGFENVDLIKIRSGKYYGLLRNNTDLIIEPYYKDIDIYPNGFIILKDRSLQGLLRWDGESLNWMFPMIHRNIGSIHKVDNKRFLVIASSVEFDQCVYVIDGFKAIKLLVISLTNTKDYIDICYKLNNEDKTMRLYHNNRLNAYK